MNLILVGRSYLFEYILHTEAWKFTSRSVTSAKSGRVAYREDNRLSRTITKTFYITLIRLNCWKCKSALHV